MNGVLDSLRRTLVAIVDVFCEEHCTTRLWVRDRKLNPDADDMDKICGYCQINGFRKWSCYSNVFAKSETVRKAMGDMRAVAEREGFVEKAARSADETGNVMKFPDRR